MRRAARLIALVLVGIAGVIPALSPAEAAHRRRCRFCGPPWYYPEPEIDEPTWLPHGFIQTIAVGRTVPAPTLPVQLGRYGEIGPALARCWNPAQTYGGPWSAITLRVSFRRDGTVNGEPRIPYVAAPAQREQAALREALLKALERCTPLPFTPALGAAIAGEIFAIRFTHEDKS